MMRPTTTGLLLALALIAAGCARTTTIPGAPDGGYSGAGAGGPGGAGTMAAAGGTLPGTNIGDTVLFAVDQSTLGSDAIAILDQQVGWLSQNPGTPVEIQGHADERGTSEYNLALGASRASAVRNYMVSRGIPDARISIITFGRERPVATCADESCYARNRRAVTVVTGAVGS